MNQIAVFQGQCHSFAAILLNWMGVYKLWELLLTVAQPMAVEDLGGKVLAIDASIWIVKIDSLYGSNAEKLRAMLSKIMLLKRNNILPLFVFDGVAPAIKRRTLEERYRRRLVAGEQDARKKSELEVMRLVEGSESTTRVSERFRRAQKNEQELTELNKTLSILSEFQQKAEEEVGSEVVEKIAMQSEILNTKYRIMLELTPALADYRYFIPPQEYEGLDLEQKMEYLDELEEQKWRAVRAERRGEALTEEAKLMRDLQAIQKRSIVREMQDQLFRKMMQKNVTIVDGFEIVETIYNGRKVVQKRKVRQPGNTFGFNLRKGKMKNNAACLNFQQENLSEDEPQDEFLADFCSSTVSVKPTTITGEKERALNSTNSNPSRPSKPPKNKPNRQKKKVQKHSDESEDSAVYLPFQNYQERQHEDEPERYVNREELEESREGREQGRAGDEFEDRDRLPAYVPNESLLHINYSNDNLELQSLLKALGIPFLVAPSEAEAQCAALEQLGVVEGVVTEDSDAFLFGAKHVFRGVFQGNVRMYDSRSIEERLRLNREKLIIFALLLGSDYTPGVKGVGLVNAMEILKAFASLDRLQSFKSWARLPDVLLPSSEATDQLLKCASPAEIEFYELHRKFKNHWYVDEDFGSRRVQQAYLSPEVVESSRVLALQKEGAFEGRPCNRVLLEQLLREKLALDDRQFDHFMKVLTLEYKPSNTLYKYFPKLDPSAQLARIRSKRLEKSLQDQGEKQ